MFLCFSSTTAASAGENSRGRRARLRGGDPLVRAPSGGGQEHDVRAEHRQLHRVHARLPRAAPAGRHAQHETVHVRHEELPRQARRTRVREVRRKRALKGEEPSKQFPFLPHFIHLGTFTVILEGSRYLTESLKTPQKK